MAESRAEGEPFRYVAAEVVTGDRHLIVDGAPRAGTVCTLSHWPATPTPVELWHDLSAGIVMQALARPELLPDGVASASIDHYDADGVIALALLCVDGLAAAHGPLLVEAARVGDFDVVTERRAALVAFALDALGDVERAASILGEPVPGGLVPGGLVPGVPVSDGGVMEGTAWAATQALRVLPALVEDPESWRALWADEAAAFDASCRALAEGWASIEERPEHDLAVVRVDVDHPHAPGAAWGGAPLHRAALHTNTEQMRVATIAGGSVEVRYRYESWVRMVSVRPRPRVDLDPVAAALTRAESSGARWVFDGAGAITGALHLSGPGATTLDPEDVLDTVCQKLEILDAGPPAWDPYGGGARRA